ncbi:MAG: vWA domain-containing protein [Deltaproteobacteria bacterium]|nr:vWA domain-containing protein [Deltaproteobacteria bacterium]
MLVCSTKKTSLNRWSKVRAIVAVPVAVVVGDAIAGRLLRIALILLLFGVAADLATYTPPPAPAPRFGHRTVPVVDAPVWTLPELNGDVDVVFVIDTTASMSAGIHEARAKAREVVAEVKRTNARVRVGAVAYRDRGDEYLTREIPLSADLAAAVAAIEALRAEGGGDTPEAVSSGLNHAINKMPWSLDQKTTKLVYLIGDAAPSANDGDVPWSLSAASAKSRGIVLNTVLCSSDPTAEAAFRAIAGVGGGAFSVVR